MKSSPLAVTLEVSHSANPAISHRKQMSTGMWYCSPVLCSLCSPPSPFKWEWNLNWWGWRQWLAVITEHSSINWHCNPTRRFVFFAFLVSKNQHQATYRLLLSVGVDLTVWGCNSSLMGKCISHYSIFSLKTKNWEGEGKEWAKKNEKGVHVYILCIKMTNRKQKSCQVLFQR